MTLAAQQGMLCVDTLLSSQTMANAIQRALKDTSPLSSYPGWWGREGLASGLCDPNKAEGAHPPGAPSPRGPWPQGCPWGGQVALCPRAQVCVQVTVLTSGALTLSSAQQAWEESLQAGRGPRLTDTDARRLLSGGSTGAPHGINSVHPTGICETGKVPKGCPADLGGEFEHRAWLGNAPG